MLKKLLVALTSFGAFGFSHAHAISLDDVQFWTGTGTNRAALVIHWSAPEVRNNTSVPNPAAEKSLVWGYRWDGANTAGQMFNAITAADRRLFVMASEPYVGFGPIVYALGYDLNNNGVFGIRFATNVFAENAFTNGQRVVTAEFGENNSDSAQSLDKGDLFWSGLFGANWEMWQEKNGAGGFTSTPNRGENPYWTPGDPDAPYFGSHGQWDYTSGLDLITLRDGSWIGFTVSAGGLNFMDDSDPGTIAFNFHKYAPLSPEAASTNSSFATQIVSATGPFGASPYNDPDSILGAPATRFYESVSRPATRVKLVEPAYNYSVINGVTNKLIITLNNGSSIIAKFNQPVSDHPANPYGIDFQVFGNAFYAGSGGFVNDAFNMEAYTLGTGGFYEPTKVSVSPGFTGLPGEKANDPATWPWYRYETGPYADTAFPTHAYKWNRAGTNWTDELLDFTKPVNPMMQTRFSLGALSAADGIDLFNGAGGGTGFDLGASGFASIQYIKVEGISPGFSGGEIDAFAVVRPMTIGDELSITPANITNNTTQLFFQKPGQLNQTLAALNFTAVSEVAKIRSARLDDSAALASIQGVSHNAVDLQMAPVLGSNAVTFQADITLSTGNYSGDGSDLLVWQRNGTNWNSKPFVFDAIKKQAQLSGVTDLSAFAVAQVVVAPQLNVQVLTNGFSFAFTPVANIAHRLERSVNLVAWTPVATVTPTNTRPITLEDNAPPTGNAFYRLRLTAP